MGKRAIPQTSRRAVALAAGAIPGATSPVSCTYCGAIGSAWWPNKLDGTPGAWVSLTLEIDHVIPEHHGGPSTPDNLTLACRPCNRRKGAKSHATHQDDQA